MEVDGDIASGGEATAEADAGAFGLAELPRHVEEDAGFVDVSVGIVDELGHAGEPTVGLSADDPRENHDAAVSREGFQEVHIGYGAVHRALRHRPEVVQGQIADGSRESHTESPG